MMRSSVEDCFDVLLERALVLRKEDVGFIDALLQGSGRIVGFHFRLQAEEQHGRRGTGETVVELSLYQRGPFWVSFWRNHEDMKTPDDQWSDRLILSFGSQRRNLSPRPADSEYSSLLEDYRMIWPCWRAELQPAFSSTGRAG
jgi:hypothetical protein